MGENSLIIGLLAGAVGMGYIVYGRKQGQAVPLLCGVGLCIYPYAIGESLAAGILIGALLMAVPFFVKY